LALLATVANAQDQLVLCDLGCPEVAPPPDVPPPQDFSASLDAYYADDIAEFGGSVSGGPVFGTEVGWIGYLDATWFPGDEAVELVFFSAPPASRQSI
jgi:hypothetical protein